MLNGQMNIKLHFGSASTSVVTWPLPVLQDVLFEVRCKLFKHIVTILVVHHVGSCKQIMV